MKIKELIENASAGATSSGGIATVVTPMTTVPKKKKSKKGKYGNDAAQLEDVSSLVLRR